MLLDLTCSLTYYSLLNHDSRVLEGHAVAVGALGEGLDRLAHRHGRELDLLLVALAEAEASGFPQVADGLGREAEQPRADDVRRQRVGARDDKAGLHRVAAERAVG